MKSKKLFCLAIFIAVVGMTAALFAPALIVWAAAEADKITIVGGGRGAYLDYYDEDDMASNDADGVSSQQSVKAYIDSGTATLSNKTLASPTLTGTVTTETLTLSDDVLCVAEGDTADAHETTLSFTEPTADCTYILPTDAAATYGFVVSTLATNSSTAANSVFGGTNQLIFECATADARELILQPRDDATVGDATVYIPSLNDAAAVVSGLTTNDIDVANSVWATSNDITFEGVTADAYETTISPGDPTRDTAVTIPIMSGSMMIGGKVDVGHHGVSNATEVDASTVEYKLPDAGGAVEVVCGGTSSGTTDAYYLRFYAVDTVGGGTDTAILVLTADDGSLGDWHAQAVFATSDGAAMSASGSMEFATEDPAVAGDPIDQQNTTIDLSLYEQIKVAIDLEGTTDDFSLEYCVWKILY
jgi:hypothetical protein